MKKMADMMSKAGKWLMVFSSIISALSFPIQVMAEELSNNEVVTLEVEANDGVVEVDFNELTSDEYIHTINSEDELKVTFNISYQELETGLETLELDFSKKLYGEYHYPVGSDKTLVIKYVGDNATILDNYKNIIGSTKELKCFNKECIISGFGNVELTVADITSGYYNTSLFETDYNALVNVMNGEVVLEDTATIINGYELVIMANESIVDGLEYVSESSKYVLNRVGDVHEPSDGVVDTLDQETILDNIIEEKELTTLNDINKDGKLNILDVTDSTFMNIYNGEEITDILTNKLVTSSNEVFLNEKVTVTLMVSGLDKAKLYGIEGLVKYDNNILKLVSVKKYENTSIEQTEELGYLNIENGKFAYVFKEGFSLNDVELITLEFEAIAEGSSEVLINNILESYGKLFTSTNDSVTTTIVVDDPSNNVGGDVEPNPDTGNTPDIGDDNVEQLPSTPSDTTTGATTENKENTSTVVRPVVKSSDYYIKNLVIAGYDIEFNKHTFEYSINVNSDVDKLDLEVLLNSSKSIYYVEGNENFTEGENLVKLVVKAENGSTKTYTIKVTKEKEKEVVNSDSEELEEEEEETKSNFSKTIIVILIILVIIGLIYIIFKDDEEDNIKEVTEKKTEPKKSESVKKEVSTNNTKTEVKKNSNNSAKTSKSNSSNKQNTTTKKKNTSKK